MASTDTNYSSHLQAAGEVAAEHFARTGRFIPGLLDTTVDARSHGLTPSEFAEDLRQRLFPRQVEAAGQATFSF